MATKPLPAHKNKSRVARAKALGVKPKDIPSTTGHPTTYRPEYCELIKQSLSRGESVKKFATTYGTTSKTVYEWAKIYPQFGAALEVAMEMAEAWWEDQGRLNLVEDYQGKKLNANIWKFFMQCRFRWSPPSEAKQEESISDTTAWEKEAEDCK